MKCARSKLTCLSIVKDGVFICFHPHAHVESVVLVKAVCLYSLLRGQIPYILMSDEHVLGENVIRLARRLQHHVENLLSMVRHYLLHT